MAESIEMLPGGYRVHTVRSVRSPVHCCAPCAEERGCGIESDAFDWTFDRATRPIGRIKREAREAAGLELVDYVGDYDGPAGPGVMGLCARHARIARAALGADQ